MGRQHKQAGAHQIPNIFPTRSYCRNSSVLDWDLVWCQSWCWHEETFYTRSAADGRVILFSCSAGVTHSTISEKGYN